MTNRTPVQVADDEQISLVLTAKQIERIINCVGKESYVSVVDIMSSINQSVTVHIMNKQAATKDPKDAKLNVLYVCPDRQMISETQKRDDKIAFNILQEYARSGRFQKILLVDKLKVEELAGHVPVNEYEKTISYFISYVVAMINFFKHTKPVLANPINPPQIARIVAHGVSSLEEDNKDINLLFPLDKVKDVHFYYGVPKQELDEDSTLVKRIKEHVKSYKTEEVSTSFSVYETTLDSMIVLCSAYSSKIQDFATR